MPAKSEPCTDCGGAVYDFNAGRRCGDCQRAFSKQVAAQAELAVTEIEIKNQEKKSSLAATVKKMRWRLIMTIWFIAWSLFGGGWALYERYHGDSKGCVYRSLASLTNVGFVIGCELLRERWEIGK